MNHKVLLLLSLCATGFVGWHAEAQTSESGRVRYSKRMNEEFNGYTSAAPSMQQWLRDHIDRLGVFSPFFDTKLSWFPNAWLYLNLYSIPKTSPLVAQHPEWILKDAQGNRLFIPWGCSGGTCPQYAGDIANPAFRQWWINDARPKLAKGYKGLFIDDVNMMFRVGNGNQVEVPPIDRNTGAPMSYDNWRRYIAEFTEFIRAQLPSYEIVHNSIWFGGPVGIRDRDPSVLRQIGAANYINIERGVSDGGLTGGTGIWSLRELLSYIDRIHARGKSVVMDEYYPPNLEYSLGSYFLISTDKDMIGDLATTPNNWWPGYDVVLGTPRGQRYDWQNLIRRDFSGGLVLVNEPGAPTRTVTLPGSYRTLTNQIVTSVTLAAKTGAVLQTVASVPASPPPGEGSYYPSDMTWKSAINGFGPAERNMSNGAAGTADGRGIRLGGVSFAKGLGVHANSDIRINLGGACSTFNSTVGIDDEVGSYGSVIFQVYADGIKIFESPVMTGGTANRDVNVSVVGKNELRLLVQNAGDGINSDHADWANARLSCASSPSAAHASSYLSDRVWLFGTNGFGPVELNRSNGNFPAGDGRQMSLNNVTYAKGLGVHAPAEIRYALNGTCSAFQAVVGVDDEVGSYGSISFEVWVDSVRLFASGLMRGTTASRIVNLNLAGKNELRLVVLDGGDGIESDHGDWADAKLTCQG